MLRRVRYFFTDLFHWLGSHKLIAAGALLAVLVAGGVVVLVLTDGDGDDTRSIAPAPQVVVAEVPAPEEAEDLGFPAFATKNTTRVSGSDAIVNAAAVVLAVHPSTGDAPSPAAVSLVEDGDWRAAVAAASLVGAPVGAPILVGDADEVPELTASALRELDPRGSSDTAGRQVFVIGDAAVPDDYETLELAGGDPAAVAAEVARLRDRLAGEPEHIVVASADAPAYSVPAAGWAARSGDPVLFVSSDGVPEATAKTLRRFDGVPVYVLGPESAVSDRTMTEIERIAPGAKRVGAEGAVDNAIAFARFVDGGFGWNINDPGHGFVLASTERPLDAAVASPLSASGTWGPLLVTDDGSRLPASLRTYLLDLKPGYETDPTRALYNHVWLIGDPEALSVELQADVDGLAEVAEISSGSGTGDELGPPPGRPESQPDDEPQRNQDR